MIVIWYILYSYHPDIPVTLIHPYCIGEEPTTYDIVDGHALAGQGTFEVQQQQNTAVGSKGGYLTKRGNIVKVSDTFPMLFITQPFSPLPPFGKVSSYLNTPRIIPFNYVQLSTRNLSSFAEDPQILHYLQNSQ